MGLMVRMDGGTVPDLRLYNGEFRRPLSPLTGNLCLPVFWSAAADDHPPLNGNLPDFSEITSRSVRRSSVHLVEISLNMDDSSLTELHWQSLMEVQLVRYPGE